MFAIMTEGGVVRNRGSPVRHAHAAQPMSSQASLQEHHAHTGSVVSMPIPYGQPTHRVSHAQQEHPSSPRHLRLPQIDLAALDSYDCLLESSTDGTQT